VDVTELGRCYEVRSPALITTSPSGSAGNNFRFLDDSQEFHNAEILLKCPSSTLLIVHALLTGRVLQDGLGGSGPS